MPRVVIIGGGITGLAAAWELQKRGIDYTLLEASGRLGGKIVTEHVGGFTIEGGPDSWLVRKSWVWQLCRELGLEDHIIGTNEAERNLYILRHGKLHLFPKGMRLIIPVDEQGLLESDVMSAAGKRRMLAEVEMQPYEAPADESMASFVRRHFGDEALEVFGEPILGGIYVGNSEEMSIRATYPEYVAMERTHGSLIRAARSARPSPPPPDMPKSMFISLKGGSQELVDTLAQRLNGDIRTGCGVENIRRTSSGFQIDGSLVADAVIVTTPPRHARQLLAEHGALSAALDQFATVASLSASLGYHQDAVPRPLDGFGFVIPRAESPDVSACTWSSTKLPGRAPADHVLIRMFSRPVLKDAALTQDQMIERARAALSTLMGIDPHCAPTVARAFLTESPQYNVGHLELVAEVEALCPPGLVLAGSAYRGVGVPDCIHQGQIAAQKTMAFLGIYFGTLAG